MRICVVPSDNGGCGQYRLRWPAEALIAQGNDSIVLSDQAEDQSGKDFDVVVVQRPARRAMLEHIQVLQAAGVAVVVDMDDDFSAIPFNNVTYRGFHPKYSPDSNRDIIAQACRIADLVTVSTPALAHKYGAHGRVRLLRNYIPRWYLDVQPHPSSAMCGWSGAVETHPDDLQVTRGALNSFPFKVIGKGNGVRQALNLDTEPEATGWLDIHGDYQQAVASLSVGIVPLVDNAFNRAKSWLKGLEMAALGVPFVASPTPEYQQLFQKGGGRLAKRQRDWRGEVRQLLADPEGSRLSGIEAAKVLTIEKNAWRWAEAWNDAYINRSIKCAG